MKKIFIICLLIGFANNLFAKDKPQAGIFIENYDGMTVFGQSRPGITKQRYYFGHRWSYHDFNNDGVKDRQLVHKRTIDFVNERYSFLSTKL